MGWRNAGRGGGKARRLGRTRISPGDGGHPGLFAGIEFDQIGPPVSRNHEVRADVGPCGFHEDEDAGVAARAAFGVADDPAGGVARCDRAGARQAFAGFERDGRNLARSRVDLIERTLGPGIDLDRVEIPRLARLDARGRIGIADLGDGCLGHLSAPARGPGGRDMERARPVIGCRHGRCRQGRHRVVIGECGRAIAGAAGEKRGSQKDGGQDRSGHWLISRDQLIAFT